MTMENFYQMYILRINTNHYIQHPTPFLSVFNPPLPIDPSACTWFIQLYRYYINKKKNSSRNTITFFSNNSPKEKLPIYLPNLMCRGCYYCLVLTLTAFIYCLLTGIFYSHHKMLKSWMKHYSLFSIFITFYYSISNNLFFMDQRLIYIHFLLT